MKSCFDCKAVGSKLATNDKHVLSVLLISLLQPSKVCNQYCIIVKIHAKAAAVCRFVKRYPEPWDLSTVPDIALIFFYQLHHHPGNSF